MAAEELHHHRPDKVNDSGKHLLYVAMQNKFVWHIRNLKQTLANLADCLTGER